MALRLGLLYLCMCMCLLLVAASAQSPPPLGAGARAACYKTLKGVPQDCAQEFLRVLFSGNNDTISAYCCQLLACVREASCAIVLHSMCVPPERDQCAPPRSVPPSAAPVSTGTTK